MITGNNCDLGSWKCGKARVFTHIPTNFILQLKVNSWGNIKKKKGGNLI